ncbi:MAG: C40 family peptidase [Desulfovibrio sp.]|nr:C40 family peptidase [Desulfovibrio sp.]
MSWSYAQTGINLPRRARDQIQFGIPVQKKEELEPGDIVVFRDRRSRTGWHSGIYSGEGRFIHSPSQGRTVEEIRLDEEYYARRFAGARRIPRDGREKAMFAAYQEKLRSQTKASTGADNGKKTAAAKSVKKGKAGKTEKAGKRALSQRSKKIAPAKEKTAPAKGQVAPTRGQAAKSALARANH